MTRTPPLLPEETLMRVLRMARINGLGMLVVAGFFSVLSAMAGDYVGTMAGLIVAGGGALEVHGGTMVAHQDSRGMNWLVSSELVALVGILAYCAVRLVHVQIPPVPDDLKATLALDAQQLGMTVEQLLVRTYRIGFEIIAVLSVVYQGGIALYYARRRRAVQRALDQIASD
ncbi:MAG TPA: hypothetical protein VHE61_16880 [Opitutaceae bacterium]|nr:hypothetical protein [Opitutaceae bacterium]